MIKLIINFLKIKSYEKKGLYTHIMFSHNLDRKEAWRVVISDVENEIHRSKRIYSFVEAQKYSLIFLSNQD